MWDILSSNNGRYWMVDSLVWVNPHHRDESAGKSDRARRSGSTVTASSDYIQLMLD
jgi:hypothetical protein